MSSHSCAVRVTIFSTGGKYNIPTSFKYYEVTCSYSSHPFLSALVIANDIYTANIITYCTSCTPRWGFISSVQNCDHMMKTLYTCCEPIANLTSLSTGHPVFKLVGPLSIIQSKVIPFINQAELFESWLNSLEAG